MHELPAEQFELPPGKSEKFTLIEITAFPGRSENAKRLLYKSIVRRLGEVGIAPDDVLIVINEPPLTNWGIRGGQAANEVELGFKLDI